jgi:hypothetical protein
MDTRQSIGAIASAQELPLERSGGINMLNTD